MKIAINWFEVSLPTASCEIPVEYFDSISEVPRYPKSPTFRTVLRSNNRDRPALYYIIDPSIAERPDVGVEDLTLYDDPTLVSHIIEQGFAAQLDRSGFQVTLHHVGGLGYKITERSKLPNIYISLDGIKFRCYFGFGRREQLRWGLILSYVVGHYFRVSLADDTLRQLAVGKRVLQLKIDADEGSETGEEESTQKSGILEAAPSNEWHVVDQEGNSQTISLDEWTLPCRTDTLLNYVRLAHGQARSSQLATALQQDALTLTSENRMNTALARHQFEKLRTLLSNRALDTFPLPLPRQLYARLSQEPLEVG